MVSICNNIRCIIIWENQILVIKISDGTDEYCILPGGKLELGETAPEALKRECIEEIGCDVNVGKCVFIREFIGSRRDNVIGNVAQKQFLELYFLTELTDTPDLIPREDHQKEILWVNIDDLDKIDLKPEFLKTHLATLNENQTQYLGDVD